MISLGSIIIFTESKASIFNPFLTVVIKIVAIIFQNN